VPLILVWVICPFLAPYAIPWLLAAHVSTMAHHVGVPAPVLESIGPDIHRYSRQILLFFIPWWITLGCCWLFDWNPANWIILGLGLLMIPLWIKSLLAVRKSLLHALDS